MIVEIFLEAVINQDVLELKVKNSKISQNRGKVIILSKTIVIVV
jgi:hypothetical protein